MAKPTATLTRDTETDDWDSPNRLEPEDQAAPAAKPTPINEAAKMRPRRCVTNHNPDDGAEVPHLDENTEYHTGDRIQETITALRREFQELGLIEDYRIVSFWTSKGLKKSGKPQYGTAQKPAGLLKYLTQRADFVIVMSTETCRGLANYEFEAAVYHQLCHCSEIESTNIDGDSTYRAGVIGHEFEGFTGELKRYGFWNSDLRAAVDDYAAQLKLPMPAAN